MISDSNKLSEAVPYMDPTNATMKNHSKISNNDYETLPVLNMYEKAPDNWISNVPYRYEIAAASAFRESIEGSMVDEALYDDEQIYEDPGYKKEEIYAWFEEKKFRKIRESDIKYVE